MMLCAKNAGLFLMVTEKYMTSILVVRQSGFLRLLLWEIRYVEVREHRLDWLGGY